MTASVLFFWECCMGLLDVDDINLLQGKQKIKQNKKPAKKEIVPKKEDVKIDYNNLIPEDERVQMHETIKLDAEKYQDFAGEKYPYSLNFYDFEVFVHDWCVTVLNPIELTQTIIVNDTQALKRYYNKHKNQIWVGYNSRNYDTYILKSIILGMNPKKINDQIIYGGMKGWQISDEFNDIELLDFDVAPAMRGLKQLEAFMGDDIRETDVPFDLPRKLTYEEIRQTVKYCTHDVKETIEVFRRRKSEYDAQVDLIESFRFDINKIGKTQAQLASNILKAKKKNFDDDWEIRLPTNLNLGKYEYIADWFLNPKNHNEKASLEIEIAGLKHIVAWGGIHAGEKIFVECNDDEIILDADVGQLYPNIMRHYHLLSRASTKPKMLDFVLDTSMRLKREGKKKEREPYKRQCNIFYGAMGDKTNSLYDPLYRKLVCIYGQVFIVDLIDKIEDKIQLLQSNTDGIFFKVKKTDVEEVKRRINKWQDRTKLVMEYDEYIKYIAKDVNNYITVSSNGKLHRKGAYVMELNDLNYDLPIVNKALVDYMMSGVPVEDTINNCNALKEFQKIVKISSNYKGGWHNNKYLTDKTFRVFASKNNEDTYLGKYKYEGATVEKFANTPEHAFIVNRNVNGLKVVNKLDRSWYINLAKKRLEDFGIKINEGIGGLL